MPLRLLLACCLLYTYTVNAQYQQGNIWVDGSTSWQYSDPAEDFIFKGGAFVVNKLLVGLDLRADTDRLLTSFVPEPGVARYELFTRYYLGRPAARWHPYAELGFGTLTNQTNLRTLRPVLGLEGRLLPGAYGRISLGYEYTLDYQAYQLEVGSSIGFNDWSTKDRIPRPLSAGQWVINTHFVSLSLIDREEVPYDIYGAGRIQVGFVVGGAVLAEAEVAGLRELPLLPDTVQFVRNAATADLGVNYLPLRDRINYFDPYVGLGATYGRIEQEPFANDTLQLRAVISTRVSPYGAGGAFIHLSDRISLRIDVRRYYRRPTPLEKPWQFRLGTMFRLGRVQPYRGSVAVSSVR